MLSKKKSILKSNNTFSQSFRSKDRQKESVGGQGVLERNSKLDIRANNTCGLNFQSEGSHNQNSANLRNVNDNPAANKEPQTNLNANNLGMYFNKPPNVKDLFNSHKNNLLKFSKSSSTSSVNANLITNNNITVNQQIFNSGDLGGKDTNLTASQNPNLQNPNNQNSSSQNQKSNSNIHHNTNYPNSNHNTSSLTSNPNYLRHGGNQSLENPNNSNTNMPTSSIYNNPSKKVQDPSLKEPGVNTHTGSHNNNEKNENKLRRERLYEILKNKSHRASSMDNSSVVFFHQNFF